MEVVLLWLDDLDDLIFSSALIWERLRRTCLQIGLVVAIVLALGESPAVALAWAPELAGIAGSAASSWLLGACCGLRAATR